MRTLFALFLTVVAWPAVAQGPAPGKLLVRFETTMGAFTVALDTERAPLSSANIARYATAMGVTTRFSMCIPRTGRM